MHARHVVPAPSLCAVLSPAFMRPVGPQFHAGLAQGGLVAVPALKVALTGNVGMSGGGQTNTLFTTLLPYIYLLLN